MTSIPKGGVVTPEVESKNEGTPDYSSLEDGSQSKSPTTSIKSEKFFITRLLLLILPRSWTTVSQIRKPSVDKPPPFWKYLFRPLSPISRFLFSYSFPLMWASALGHQLEFDGFSPLSKTRHVADKTVAFNDAFAYFRGHVTSKRRSRAVSRFPLLRALFAVFKVHLAYGMSLTALYVIVAIGQIILFKPILEYLAKFYHADPQTVSAPSLGYGVGLVAASAALVFITYLLKTRSYYAMCVVGGEMRTILAAALTVKGFSISPLAQKPSISSKKAGSPNVDRDSEFVKKRSGDNGDSEEPGWTVGTMLSLVNTDTERIQYAMKNLNETWSAYLMLLILGPLSYWLIGWPTFAAMGCAIILSLPLLPMLRHMSKIRVRINAATDARVTRVSDLVSGIRLLKMCAWEDVYADLVRDIRQQEVKLNASRIRWAAGSFMCCTQVGRAPVLLAFGLYSLNSNFSSAGSLSTLVFMTLMANFSQELQWMPRAMTAVVDGWQSLCRIEEFLLAEDSLIGEERRQKVTEIDPKEKCEEGAIDFAGAEFSWTRPENEELTKGSPFFLEPLTVSLHPGELLAIVGPTSSGKSSLAAAMAGCMPLINGNVSRRSLPIYVPATTWIRSTTLRENILFGLRFDPTTYSRVITSCGLDIDLASFSSRDMTILGEKGITLSGGQRARVGLARGIYAGLLPLLATDGNVQPKPASNNQGIIIMDDPLSALDARTGASVFQNAILQGLGGLSRVLVTHQVHVLQLCDRIVWMEHGKIKAVGSFQEMMEEEAGFRDFVGEKTQLEDDKSEDSLQKTEFSTESGPDRPGEEVMQDEERGAHKVPLSLYSVYMNLRSTWWYLIFVMAILVLSQIGNILYRIVFAWWEGQAYGLSNTDWVGIILAVMAVHGTAWVLFNDLMQIWLNQCSENAATRAMNAVLRAPVSFLDTTPSGRILNRFTHVRITFSQSLKSQSSIHSMHGN